MDPDRLNRLEALFQEAVRRAPAERPAFLARACADEPDLRAEVEALLAADEAADAEAYLEDVPPAWVAHLGPENAGTEADSIVGGRVGPYRVFRRLGHGGMGDVYQAVRLHPFKQYVALKIIRRGLDSKEVVARFEMERQILASLNHPNIARLLDGGVTDDGLPYFALEYVEGMPITRYCDERRLTVPHRLQLFRTVCTAVHYAHRNLVVHRDLKPSNILVTEEGAVKLLDFGIAKLLNPHLSPVDLPVTRIDLQPMTPEYASPEQLRGHALTTAADVYSLGVILYEMLVGRRPYRDAASVVELLRAVDEAEPPRPSTRVTPGARASQPPGTDDRHDPRSISARRGTTPDRLSRLLRGDLDNVTLMALRKEPERRYGSAERLGQDVERYLKGMPVEARPSTLGYRAQKFMARHRFAMGAAVVVAFSLVVGTGVAVWQAAEAHRARERAERALAEAEEVSTFLEHVLSAADPYAPTPVRQDTMQLRSFLARGVARIDVELADQPLVQGRMMDVIGRVYRNLGLYAESDALLARAENVRRRTLGDAHPDVAATLVNRALVSAARSDFQQARARLEEALSIYQRALGSAHPTTALTANQLAVVLRRLGHFAQAESLHVHALEVLRAGNGMQDPRAAVVLTDLVSTLEDVGAYQTAEQYGRESVSLHRALYGRAHPQLAMAVRDLGLVLQRLGRHAEAEAHFRESMAMAQETLGDEHPQVADLLNRLASIRWWQGDYAAADSIHRQSLALKRRIYGDVHIEVAYGLNNRASVLRDLGRLDEAEALLHEALEIERATVGSDHPTYWISLANLGTVRWARGDCVGAEPIMRAAIDGLERTIPRDSIRAPVERRYLGDCLRMLGRYAESEEMLLASYRVLHAGRGADDLHTQRTVERLVALYEDWGRREDAEAWRRRVGEEEIGGRR